VVGLVVLLSTTGAACALVVDTAGLTGGDASPKGDAASSDVADALAGDAGPGDADATPFTPTTPCPTTGGAMINVGTHCIDSTEVTNTAYEAFVATIPGDAGAVDASTQPSFCSWNTDLNHIDTFYDRTAPTYGQLPVNGVDWCDAYAFCRWAGKRLCGGRDGGAAPFDAWNDPGQSQWMHTATKPLRLRRVSSG
jgi:hypothetical protein